ncbi:MFS transporter [Variovorax sp. WS11]|uniref:MFS transporter n=2 Tax=Variovorax sp. WS11 TaxID=1105204 RepID=UPI001EF25C5C|nr:MFS transporter [Variovorax sp. WS11]
MNRTANPALMNDAHELRRKAMYRKITWRLIPLLFLAYVVSYIDRINVGYAKLQMSSDLHLTDAIYGLGAGIFFVGYALFEVPSNVLLMRIGARLTIMRIMVCWGLISAATMFVTTPTQFYIARFLLGAFEAGFFPGIVLYLTFWFPAARRARIIALFMSATVIGGLIAGPMSGWILQNLDGWYGLRGWQWMFLLEGLPAAALGFVVYACLSNSPEEAKWLSEDEKRLIRIDMPKDAAPHGSTPPVEAALAALRDSKVYLLSFLYFAAVCGGTTLSFWMPTMIQSLGVKSMQTIGLISAVPYAFAALAMILYGRSSDKRGERRWHYAVAVAVGGVGLALTSWTTTDMWVSVALISIAVAGSVSALPVFWAVATTELSRQSTAAGIAIITSLGNLAGLACPYILGVIKQTTGSMTGGLLFIAGIMLAGAMVMVGSGSIRRGAAALRSAPGEKMADVYAR